MTSRERDLISTSSNTNLESFAQSFSNLKKDILPQITGSDSESKIKKLERAVNTKDPMTLPTLEERGASVDGKLKRLAANPEYQKLDPSSKIKTRLQIYNKYVVPGFKAAGVKPPDVKVWLKGTKDTSNIIPSQNIRRTGEDIIGSSVASATHAAEGLTLFGAKISRQFLREAYGMAEYFSGAKEETYAEARSRGIKAADRTIVGKAVKATADAYNQSEFWLQTHPRNSMLASASSWTAEQVVQLPIYEALGAANVGMGLMSKLTPRLLSSPVGRFTARRIGDGFAGFASNMITTGNEASTKENLGAAAGFAAFGGLLEGSGSWLKKVRNKPIEGEYLEPIQTASDSSIKKLTAESLAVGGKPFVHDVTDTSFHELISNPSKELTASNTPVDIHKLDPSLAALKTGEQMALQSIALRSYGMSLDKLPHELQQKVLQRRYELIEEASSELPAHVPDLNRAEVVSNLKTQMESNPEFAKSVDELKKLFGIDVAEVVNKNQIDDIKLQTGIKSSGGVSKKVSFSRESVSNPKEQISPRDFAQHKIDSSAYFKKSPGPRRAEDGTLIGGRDKRSWNERLKAENTKDFIETLKEADGNRIKFENPYHRMLFHWSNRNQLPEIVQNKLFYELKKAEPELSKPEFNHQADRLTQHLQMLAQSGRLTKDKNVFKSTKVNSGKFTEWQASLNTEIDKQELEFLAKTIDQHPNGLKSMKGIVQIFQANRRMNLGKPEDWATHNKVLSNLLSGVIE